MTASYTAGDYRWHAYTTRNSDSERLTIDSGTFEVVANRSASTADLRSHVKIMLDKIESILEGRADGDVAAYSINGRSLTKLGTAYTVRVIQPGGSGVTTLVLEKD